MKWLTRILTFAFAAFVLAFIGFQLVRYLSQPYTTETALSYSTARKVDTVGVAVRGEQLIDAARSGSVGYLYEDGSKVAAGSLVTAIYTSRTALSMQSQLESIQAEIDMLREAQETGMSFLANTEALMEKIADRAYTLMDHGDSGNFAGAERSRLDFLSLVNKKQIATNRETDYAARIAELEMQYDQIAASVPEPEKSVFMPVTGYFSSVTDGYETLYTPDALLDGTVESIAAMLSAPATRATRSVGKVITKFNWYYAVVVSAQDADRLVASGAISASFPTLGISEIPFTVYKTVEQPDADPKNKDASVAVIFTCNYMDASLSALRVQNVELAMRSYTGLRISREAIRFADGVKGVYVRVGYSLRFKPIEDYVLYEEDDFVLVQPSDDARYLQLYDVIVVRGMGLYDGKSVS